MYFNQCYFKIIALLPVRVALLTCWLVAMQLQLHAHTKATEVADALDRQPHSLFKDINQELSHLKAIFPHQTSFFITQDATPHLYSFLMPTIKKLCNTAKISTEPQFLVSVGNTSDTFNAQSNASSVVLGENFLKLFLWDSAITPCVFSIIAHELGHLFYELAKEQSKANSETLADEFALRLVKEQESLITALTLTTVSIYLFSAVEQFFHGKDQQYSCSDETVTKVIVPTTYHLYNLIKKNNYGVVNELYPNNQVFSQLFKKALESLPLGTTDNIAPSLTQSVGTMYNDPQVLDGVAKKVIVSTSISLYQRVELFIYHLIQAISAMCNNPKIFKWFIGDGAMVTSTHPPLCQRITHIQSFKV
jgi:hypothetical protein